MAHPRETRQIIYNQGDGMCKTELVQPPQTLLTYLQIPLNVYGIFWFANFIVYTVNFFKKSTYLKRCHFLAQFMIYS